MIIARFVHRFRLLSQNRLRASFDCESLGYSRALSLSPLKRGDTTFISVEDLCERGVTQPVRLFRFFSSNKSHSFIIVLSNQTFPSLLDRRSLIQKKLLIKEINKRCKHDK